MSIAVPSSQFCIAIASHIREISRVSFLLETLTSLVNQSIKIPIYLSISFDNDAISTECLRMIKTNKEIEMNNNMLNIFTMTFLTKIFPYYNLQKLRYLKKNPLANEIHHKFQQSLTQKQIHY